MPVVNFLFMIIFIIFNILQGSSKSKLYLILQVKVTKLSLKLVTLLYFSSSRKCLTTDNNKVEYVLTVKVMILIILEVLLVSLILVG